MGSTKKEAQAARRAARAEVKHHREVFDKERKRMIDDFTHEMNRRLGVLNNLLKPRPKFVPKMLWRMMAKFFIDIEAAENAMTFKNPNK